jgi:hypothetical protein
LPPILESADRTNCPERDEVRVNDEVIGIAVTSLLFTPLIAIKGVTIRLPTGALDNSYVNTYRLGLDAVYLLTSENTYLGKFMWEMSLQQAVRAVILVLSTACREFPAPR